MLYEENVEAPLVHNQVPIVFNKREILKTQALTAFVLSVSKETVNDHSILSVIRNVVCFYNTAYPFCKELL